MFHPTRTVPLTGARCAIAADGYALVLAAPRRLQTEVSSFIAPVQCEVFLVHAILLSVHALSGSGTGQASHRTPRAAVRLITLGYEHKLVAAPVVERRARVETAASEYLSVW